FRRVTMLLQSPIRVEKCCPRWWSLATAGGLFGLALFVSGIGLRADAAASNDERQTLTAAALEQGETPNADEKDEKPVEKKQSKKKAMEKVLRDLEELLKEMPSAVDADQVKRLQEHLKQTQAEVERGIEALKQHAEAGELDVLKDPLNAAETEDR